MTQKVRVYNLAVEFGFEKNEMVTKIQNFGFDVKNYFSNLSQDDAEKVKWFLKKERDANTVEEKIRPTVLRRRVKETPASDKNKSVVKVLPKNLLSPSVAV